MDHHRVFEMNNLSADHLRVGNSCYSEPGLYAVVYVFGNPPNMLKDKSPVYRDGGAFPTWNYGIKFTLDDAMLRNNQLTFKATIYRKCYVRRDMVVGNFDIPLKDLFDKTAEKTADRDSYQKVSYQLKGNNKGTINFYYRFGELLKDPKQDGYPSQVPVPNPVNGKIKLILSLAASCFGRMAIAFLTEEIVSAFA